MTMVNSVAPANQSVVPLSGELNIRTIAAAHAELIEAFKIHQEVVGAIDPASSVDLTLVQLIESARRTARSIDGSFTLAAPAEGGLLETLRRGGFLETAEQREFWLKTPGEQ
jgi:hypothetical protein